MIKMIFNGAKTWLFTKHDPEILKSIMQPGGVGVISAKCCNPESAGDDQKLLKLLQDTVDKCGLEQQVNLETITIAQKSLRTLSRELTDKNKNLVDKITALFNTKGLGIFPLTIIDGDIEFYGGIPTEEMIFEKIHTIGKANAA